MNLKKIIGSFALITALGLSAVGCPKSEYIGAGDYACEKIIGTPTNNFTEKFVAQYKNNYACLTFFRDSELKELSYKNMSGEEALEAIRQCQEAFENLNSE